MQTLASFGIQRVYDQQLIPEESLLEPWNIFIGYTGTPQYVILEGRANGVKLFFKYSSSRRMSPVSICIYIHTTIYLPIRYKTFPFRVQIPSHPTRSLAALPLTTTSVQVIINV